MKNDLIVSENWLKMYAFNKVSEKNTFLVGTWCTPKSESFNNRKRQG